MDQPFQSKIDHILRDMHARLKMRADRRRGIPPGRLAKLNPRLLDVGRWTLNVRCSPSTPLRLRALAS